MQFQYRGLVITVDKDKVDKYEFHKAIPFDQEEIDLYMCCELGKKYSDPLNHLDEIGPERISEIVARYLDREIKVVQY